MMTRVHGGEFARTALGARPGAAGSAAGTIVYVVGARPNFVKMAPVVQEMRRRAPQLRHVLVHTGQHYDSQMSDVFFRDLGVPAPDHFLGVGPGPHGLQTARALERVEALLMDLQPLAVVVPGDVNSTLAATLAAAKLQIPVAHLEAGLRSFDRSMPEEINRLLVDQLSRWCFTHSPEAAANLHREGVSADRIEFVGNTMIDTLVALRPRISRSRIRERLAIERRGYLLVTLHRPALVDGPLFAPVLAALTALSRRLPVVFPIHPRSRKQLPATGADLAGLHLVDPLGYVDFLSLESAAAGVITDSGGVQEETTFLGVPCFTLRENTERPITVTRGTNRLLGLDPEALAMIPEWLAEPPVAPAVLEGWDGAAATRVADVLGNALVDLTASGTPELAAAR